MTSNRPYLVRAIHQWIVDNGLTPHLVVDATDGEVVVPTQFIDDGKIVLNVSPGSVRDMELGDGFIMFGARFSGAHFNVTVPTRAVLAIYARENGKGLAFPPDEGDDPPPGSSSPGGADGVTERAPRVKSPSLRVVK